MTDQEAQIIAAAIIASNPALAQQLAAQAAAKKPSGYTPEGNNAPTAAGKVYHAWRARRDAAAADVWEDLADSSPFGGGLCRLIGGCCRTAAAHHKRGGFFAGLFD